jgi:hypothetical protein
MDIEGVGGIRILGTSAGPANEAMRELIGNNTAMASMPRHGTPGGRIDMPAR